MTQLTVIARLKAKQGREAELGEALRGLVGPTRAETGCVLYNLHRSHDDPGLFMFTETWDSRSLWEAHMKTPHITAFGARQPELAESFDLFVGEPV